MELEVRGAYLSEVGESSNIGQADRFFRNVGSQYGFLETLSTILPGK
jgi:hypothetical protein